MTKPSPIRSAEYKRKQLIKQLERRRLNPEKYREMGRKSEHTRRLKRYGLTSDQYKNLLSQQNNKCKICNNELVVGRSTHVDHCHTTGIVRGILCNYCNLVLGNARDNIFILEQAIIYLKESS